MSKLAYIDQIQRKINKARKEHNAEALVYYENNQYTTSACVDFEIFMGSAGYSMWLVNNHNQIQGHKSYWRKIGYLVK